MKTIAEQESLAGSPLFHWLCGEALTRGERFHIKVWRETPWMVDAITERDGVDLQPEIRSWLGNEFGPEASPHGNSPRAGQWYCGHVTIDGRTRIGFRAEAMMNRFIERWPVSGSFGELEAPGLSGGKAVEHAGIPESLDSGRPERVISNANTGLAAPGAGLPALPMDEGVIADLIADLEAVLNHARLCFAPGRPSPWVRGEGFHPVARLSRRLTELDGRLHQIREREGKAEF